MKTLKFTARAIGIALMAFAFIVGLMPIAASAQQYNETVLLTPRIMTVSVTSNYNATMGITKYQDLAIMAAAQCPAGTSNVVLTFALSTDGTNYATGTNSGVFYLTLGGAGAGTTAVALTNLNVGAAGYISLVSATNSFASLGITNLTVRVARKPNRNG
jgi:hypothetical protein